VCVCVCVCAALLFIKKKALGSTHVYLTDILLHAEHIFFSPPVQISAREVQHLEADLIASLVVYSEFGIDKY